MRIPIYILLVFTLIFSLTTTACPGGGGSQTPTPQTQGRDETSTQPGSTEAVDLDGNDSYELVEEWENLGQDTDLLLDLLETDGELREVGEWHISEFEGSGSDEFEMELDEGIWVITGLAGDGIVDLDIKIYDDEGELLDEDELVDNVPVVTIDLEEDMTVTVEIIPFEYEEGFDTALYLWYVV